MLKVNWPTRPYIRYRIVFVLISFASHLMLAYINLGPVHAIKLICHEKVGIFINQLTLHQVKFTIFHAIKALQQLVFYLILVSHLKLLAKRLMHYQVG